MGDDLAMVFPDDMVADLSVSVGDSIHLTKTADGFSLHSDKSDKKLFFLISRQNSVRPD